MLNRVNPSEFKVLIVDDIESNIILLRSILKSQSYSMAWATNGVKALELVEEFDPDLILLDVMMPGMSGFEVARKIREKYSFEEKSIIFITADNSSDGIVQGFREGGNDYVLKPFRVEELNIRIRHQLFMLAANRTIASQNEELKKSIVGRDRLYSVIAHDLRGPLGTVKMLLNMLINDPDVMQIGEAQLETLSMTNKTVEEVFVLLDNLLKWTKSQTGRLNVAIQSFDVNDLIIGGLSLFESLSDVKKVKLRSELSADDLTVRADYDMISTVLRNIISNAYKFSFEGGEIVVSAVKEGDRVKVSVSDTGKGIAEEDKCKLFDDTKHFTKQGTGNETGSGLGLLLCKEFIQKNGGELSFVSELGSGSTFFFTLPLAD